MAGKRFWTSDDIRCYDVHAMTSMTGSGNENNSSEETPVAGPSGGCTTPSERPGTSGGCMAGTKRLFSTADPDYDHQPNTKRMRVMQQLAQDELNQRVIKVVDRVLHNAIQEKKAETEEIDARILRLQQCLHTLRYCINFSCYNDSKGEPEKSARQRLPGLHPAVQRQMGKATPPPLPTSELLSLGPRTTEYKPLSPTTAQGGEKWLPYQSKSTSSHPGHLADMALPSAKNKATAGQHPSESTSLVLPIPQSSDKTPEKLQASQDKVSPSPQPPSPKHLPPLPPDNPLTIPQGRQRRFQSKRRLIVGNTYQYLTPVPGEETENTFRYKWQVYVRAPPGDPDLATILQSVTFVLDQSYSPHHVINIKQPPFVLSRRGWGEFKIQIMLKFTDPRNKPARLLHPLVLSRPNDALALTGLWRLGQENWYDLWVYLSNPEASSGADEGTQGKEEDEEELCPASLTQELRTGVIVSKVEDNTTIEHKVPRDYNGCSSRWVTPENTSRDQCTDERRVTSIKVGCADTSEESKVGRGKRTDIKCTESGILLSAKDMNTSNSDTKTPGDTRTNTECKDLLGIKGSVNDMAERISMVEKSNKFGGDTDKEKHNDKSDKVASLANGKVCKVYVKQSDGSLRPYLIPSHLYPLALQAAFSQSKHNKASTVARTNSDNKQEAKVMQTSVTQGLSGVVKDVSKTVKAQIISQQNVSKSSGCVVGVSGGASSVLKGNSKLDVEGTQESLLEGHSGAAALAGVKKQLFVQGQKHILNNTLKQATASENSCIPQVQRLSSQQSTNLGLGGSPIRVIALNQLQTGEIKFVMSNGQLLTLEKLKSLGLQVLADGGQKKIVTSLGTLPFTTTTSVSTATSSTPPATTTTTTSTGSVLIQGEQQVAGSSKIKLMMSKDKVNLMQILPLKLNCKKASNTVSPIQSLLKWNVSPINTVSQKSGGGGGGGGVTSLSMKNILLGTKKKEDEERECSAYWEEYLGRMCEACSSGLSTPSCVSALLRLLPVIQPLHTPPLPFSFCHAASYKDFLSWPLAKQRACEFQRAREVRLRLKECCINDWEMWTVPRLVAFARGHAHTPVACRPVIHTDKLNLPTSSPTPGNSLSSIGNFQKLEGEHQSDTTAFPTSTLEVDVVGLDEEEDELGSSKRKPGSPLKQQLKYLPFEEEMSSGCEWVGQLVSQLRLSLQPEEVGDGFRADVARAALWKAALNLMEDLLRASHFQAWQESSVVPPPTITPSHVLSALIHSRPEYDLFTELGLGTPSNSM